MPNNPDYILIDPPAVMYGPPEAIETWLAELATYPQDSPEVQTETKRAQQWLKDVNLSHAPAL